jgi:hypothetical protein
MRRYGGNGPSKGRGIRGDTRGSGWLGVQHLEQGVGSVGGAEVAGVEGEVVDVRGLKSCCCAEGEISGVAEF